MNCIINGTWLGNKKDENKQYVCYFNNTNINYSLVSAEDIFNDEYNVCYKFIDSSCKTDTELANCLDHFKLSKCDYYYVLGYQKDLLAKPKEVDKIDVDDIAILLFIDPNINIDIRPQRVTDTLKYDNDEETIATHDILDLIIRYKQFGYYGLDIKQGIIPTNLDVIGLKNILLFTDKFLKFEN